MADPRSTTAAAAPLRTILVPFGALAFMAIAMLGLPVGIPVILLAVSAIIIVLHGFTGQFLLICSARHGEQGFQSRGATRAFVVLGTVTMLANFTPTAPWLDYARSQLLFVVVTLLTLFGSFLRVQMMRYRHDFRDSRFEGNAPAQDQPLEHPIEFKRRTLYWPTRYISLKAQSFAPVQGTA